MFTLFYSLYNAMLVGNWYGLFSFNEIKTELKPLFNKIGEILTSIFNGTTTPVTDFGDVWFGDNPALPTWTTLIAFILALITSIGIVVMAVKGVKKAFGIFFMGVNRL